MNWASNLVYSEIGVSNCNETATSAHSLAKEYREADRWAR